jgi:hypothetical protein
LRAAHLVEVKQARFDARIVDAFEFEVIVENVGTETATFQMTAVLGSGASVQAVIDDPGGIAAEGVGLALAAPGIYNVTLPGTPTGQTPTPVSTTWRVPNITTDIFPAGVTQITFDLGVRIGIFSAGQWTIDQIGDEQFEPNFAEIALFQQAQIVQIGTPVLIGELEPGVPPPPPTDLVIIDIQPEDYLQNGSLQTRGTETSFPFTMVLANASGLPITTDIFVVGGHSQMSVNEIGTGFDFRTYSFEPTRLDDPSIPGVLIEQYPTPVLAEARYVGYSITIPAGVELPLQWTSWPLFDAPDEDFGVGPTAGNQQIVIRTGVFDPNAGTLPPHLVGTGISGAVGMMVQVDQEVVVNPAFVYAP